MTKQNINVVVFDGEQYGGDWPEENAAECLAWFAGKLAKIPAKFRANARIEISSIGSYEGSHYASIAITYARPETDGEESAREAAAKAKAEDQERRELQTLAALQAKYRK